MRRVVTALAMVACAVAHWPSPARAQPQAGLGGKEQTRFSLRGDVYFLEPGTRQLPDFSRRAAVGRIYTETLNVTPRSFTQGFPGVTGRYEWFAIDYHGTFRIDSAGRYRFRLTSDDGSKLFIDDSLVIDNDGVHPTRTKEGSVELRSGRHAVRVQYFQGPGATIALVLEVGRDDEPFTPFSARQLSGGPRSPGDPQQLVLATMLVGLVAFGVQQLIRGVALVLGALPWTRSVIARNHRAVLFGLGALAAVAITWGLGLDLLAGLTGVPASAGPVLSALLLAAGADLLDDLSERRDRSREDDNHPVAVHINGLIVLPPPRSGDRR